MESQKLETGAIPVEEVAETVEVGEVQSNARPAEKVEARRVGKPRILAFQERQKVEGLIQERFAGLDKQLDLLVTQATEVAEKQEFSGQKELDDLASQRATIALELDQIKSVKEGEIAAVEVELAKEQAAFNRKMQKMQEEFVAKQTGTRREVTSAITQKYEPRIHELDDKIIQITNKETELTSAKGREKTVQRLAVTARVEMLRAHFQDQKQKAVELLYTGAGDNDTASTAMNHLPNAVEVRQSLTGADLMLTPEQVRALPELKMKCTCGKTMELISNGKLYCPYCGYRKSGTVDGAAQEILRNLQCNSLQKLLSTDHQ